METYQSFVVTEQLLNEVGTLAAPRMLAKTHQAVRESLTGTAADTTLVQYSATFKEGAREGEQVVVGIEKTSAHNNGPHEFHVTFSKGDEHTGRVGRWRLTAMQLHSSPSLPYRIEQAVLDKRTDRELWRSDPIIASGECEKDAPRLLWPIGQSARAYTKRLDLAFAAENDGPVADDINDRIYAGIAVSVSMLRWPEDGQPLHCILEHQAALSTESEWTKRLTFQGVLLSQVDEAEHHLLGSCQFTVARLNAEKRAIYPDGSY